MKRAAATALIALPVSALLIAGCDDQGGTTIGHDAAATDTTTTYCKTSCDEGEVAPPIPKEVPAESTGLRRCHPGPEGGGYRVWIRNVSCDDVKRVLPFLSSLSVGAAKDPEGRVGVFRNVQWWACWAEYRARWGVIRNVCFRDDQLVFFDRA